MSEQARETAWRFLRYSAEGVPEGPVAIQYVVGLEDACQAAARAHLAAEARAERAEAQVKAVRDVLGDVSNVYAPSGVSPLVNVSLILEALDGAK